MVKLVFLIKVDGMSDETVFNQTHLNKLITFAFLRKRQISDI